MSTARRGQCALLLVLVGVPLAVPQLPGTTYAGWPALGFAVALFLVAPRDRVPHVVVAETVVACIALSIGFDLPLWTALLGSTALVLPALFAQGLLVRSGGHLRLDEVDSDRYHLVVTATAVLCGLGGLAASTLWYDVDDALPVGLTAFLASLTSLLAVLPLLSARSTRARAGHRAELAAQRLLLVLAVALVFGTTIQLAVIFVIFPMLGWAAIRATRREALWQLFLVCVTAYALTLYGRGPLAGPMDGVPDWALAALLYVFIAAACLMTVPLTLAVEQLVAMTTHATRATTTVERLLDSVSGAMIIAADSAGRITHFNAGAQQTLGYAPEEVLGRPPSMFHTRAELERQAEHFGVAVEHSVITLEMVRLGERRDWEFTHKDGTPRMASFSVSEVTDLEGATIGFIGAGDDITERLRGEQALVTALARERASVQRLEEADQVKQELVSNVSHELRTPITSISGYAEVLSDGSLGDLTEAQVDAVGRIERNTKRLGLLVEDLLTLSRVESGRLEMDVAEFDLRDVAAEALELVAELVHVRTLDLDVVLPEHPVPVLGDAHAMERVVLNLLSNAIKFTPDRGRVTLVVTHTDRAPTLSVCDTGVGITEEDQEHLFTRFFRTADATERAIQGTGLGLSIVHSIVTQHGGDVSVESTYGQGTTVSVTLPQSGSETQPPRVQAA